MSTVSISYSKLRDGWKSAKDVADRLDDYASALEKKVIKKFNKYDGSWSSHLTTAKTNVEKKINSLRGAESDYRNYSSNLKNLKERCIQVDDSIKSKVFSLTASFKSAHGIRNSKVENAINYIGTGLKNKTRTGRYIGDKYDELSTTTDYLKSTIKEWYNYEGGKEALKAAVSVALQVTLAVLGAVIAIGTFLAAAVVTLGGVLVLVAGLVGASIAILDAGADYQNEIAAYEARQNNDPATARRRGDINSLSDYLRSSYVYGADGETYHYDETLYNIAAGIEITDFLCNVVDIVDGISGLAKNLDKVTNFDFRCADFFANIKDTFWNVDGTTLDALKSTKEIFGVFSDIVNEDYIGAVRNIVFPGIVIGKGTEIDGKDIKVTLDDLFDLGKDIKEDFCEPICDVIGVPEIVSDALLENMSIRSIVNVSIKKCFFAQPVCQLILT